jgi:hypothetical protein
VIGGLLLSYVVIMLPMWFKSPNPVIFVPCDFAAVGLYLLYINLAAGGKWFLSFAFPVTGFVALIVTAVVTLMRYIRRGRLYIFGGASIGLAFFSVLVEYMIHLNFKIHEGLIWSVYPFIVLFLIGIMLIVIAIVRPFRESLKKIFAI